VTLWVKQGKHPLVNPDLRANREPEGSSRPEALKFLFDDHSLGTKLPNENNRVVVLVLAMRRHSAGRRLTSEAAYRQPFRLIYVGQGDDLNRKMSDHRRDDLPLWSDGGSQTLYVSLLLAPNSSKNRRCEAESAIICNYAPCFNKILSGLPEPPDR